MNGVVRICFGGEGKIDPLMSGVGGIGCLSEVELVLGFYELFSLRIDIAVKIRIGMAGIL